jgi:hypothetical protein
MARLPKARYTREFRGHAVSMARDEVPEIAKPAVAAWRGEKKPHLERGNPGGASRTI